MGPYYMVPPMAVPLTFRCPPRWPILVTPVCYVNLICYRLSFSRMRFVRPPYRTPVFGPARRSPLCKPGVYRVKPTLQSCCTLQLTPALKRINIVFKANTSSRCRLMSLFVAYAWNKTIKKRIFTPLQGRYIYTVKYLTNCAFKLYKRNWNWTQA